MKTVGIIRVSERKGREGEGFASPKQQRDRIEQACVHSGDELVACFDEIDVSGGRPLARRPGLLRAVEMIEAGEADHIYVAYFDRLVRSLKVQQETIERVEHAGGEILTLDHGQITNGSAAKRLEANIIGAMAQYFREQTKEKSEDAQRRAIDRGVIPFTIPTGYVRADDGTAVIDPLTAPMIRRAFRMRTEGNTHKAIWEYLQSQGIDKSPNGVRKLLRNRLYLGILEFGSIVRPDVCEPIIDQDTWDAVQRTRGIEGRKGKSERLLARLGVLRCATCGSRMVVGRSTAQHYNYKCHADSRCDGRPVISAKLIEPLIEEATRLMASQLVGERSNDAQVREAERELASARSNLDAFVQGCDGLEGDAIKVGLTSRQEALDAAQAQLDQLAGNSEALSRVTTAEDWDRLPLDTRRALVRAFFAEITVVPAAEAKGIDRIKWTLRMHTDCDEITLAARADAQRALDHAVV